LSLDLERLHLKVHTDPDYHAYCAMGERVNCETVATSDWAVTMGLPTAVWGIFAYLALAALAIWGLRARLRTPSWPFGLLFMASLGALGYSIALAFISHFVIGSVCLVCAATYVVNLVLFGLAWAELRRAKRPLREQLGDEVRSLFSAPAPMVIFVAIFLAMAAVTRVVVPTYWSVVTGFGPGGLAVGETPDGAHWIGATKPTLTIYEFSDYQCPHCLRGHEQMRRLLAKNGKRLRLVHRHFPLDQLCNNTMTHPFHVNACAYSFLAHCAGKAGKFWEANDFLFANGNRHQPVSPEELAQAIGIDDRALSACVASESTWAAIQADLAVGKSYKIQGTPTFVVGDRTYPGSVPPDVINAALGGKNDAEVGPTGCEPPDNPSENADPGACLPSPAPEPSVGYGSDAR